MTFIEQQQEEAREKLVQGMPDGFANLSDEEVNEVISQVVQNTRADWLRSEIEKLEEQRMLDNGLHIDASSYNEALTSIITRYKEELKDISK